MKRNFGSALLAICTLLIVSSCSKKEGCTAPTATNYDPDAEKNVGCLYEETYAVEMHVHQFLNDIELEEEMPYVINGVNTNLNLAQFYVSGITLVDANGNEFKQDGLYLLVQPETEEYAIGDFPAGDYTSVKFDIGIDSATNHGDPSLYPIGDPLGAQTPSMHWGWSFGYIFMRIDGEVDSDGDGTPDPAGAFEMHLGTDHYLASIEVEMPISIGQGLENIVHLQADYTSFFTGVDMVNDNTTHTTDNVTLANLLLDNIYTMFSPGEE